MLPLVETETALADLLPDSARTSRERRRRILLAQRAALATLTRRTDSLLLTLNPEMAARQHAADSAQKITPPAHRWSVALAFAPERNFFGLQAPASDTLAALRRTHEQGSRGFSAALLAEYRLNERWSVAGGAGLSTYSAELRLTDRRTTITYDTTLTTVITGHEVRTRAWSIRVTQVAQANPILNVNNQVIGYDTVYVPRRDTVWTYLVRTDTIRTTQQALTPRAQHEVTSTQILRPHYRFLTLPVLVRYRLGNPDAPGTRWWADVAVGAQVQAFLGGTQLVSADGRTWRTARIGPGGGLFRPISVALLGAVGLNYALTPRLSASFAPSLRYQPISVYKARTGLTQRPAAAGVQLGLKLAF